MTQIAETGITGAVTTSISSYRTQDIIDAIAEKKADATLAWINRHNITPASVLIFGAYLTGAAVAAKLAGQGNVTIVDIHPYIIPLIDCRIDYFSTVADLPQQDWDLIIDTTGLGGIAASDLSKISAEALLIEDPCSDGSDMLIRNSSTRPSALSSHPATIKGMLWTSGLGSKTSGTMTLTIEVLARSASAACRMDGTLYSIAAADFFERTLFKEQNYQNFRKSLDHPALLISSLVPHDPDAILGQHLSLIYSEVRESGEYS